MSIFQIPVIEYHSDFRRPGPGRLLPEFTLNDRQLTIGMVKSILTHNPGRAARKYMAAIVRPTLLFILDWSRPSHLALRPAFQNVVRDFSATTRVGELAQAVCYSYWHWQTDFVNIADFGTFFRRAGYRWRSNDTAPDYIMLNPKDGRVLLMEAKGTKSNRHVQQMAGALRQINAVGTNLPHNGGFACVLTLDCPSGSARLHLRDPGKSEIIPENLRHDIFRSSYASWFDLAEMDEMAEWCRTPLEKAGRIRREEFKEVLEKMNNAEDPLQKTIAEALGFDSNRVAFRLDPVVAESLSSKDAFRHIGDKLVKFSSSESSSKPGSELVFRDGTSIIPR